jgi:hypothetical protein
MLRQQGLFPDAVPGERFQARMKAVKRFVDGVIRVIAVTHMVIFRLDPVHVCITI